MKLRRPILSCLPGPARQSRLFAHLGRHCLFVLFVIGGSISAPAKDAPTTAIVLFDGMQGAAYVQITGLTLNGKTEVRICDGASKFRKDAYEAFPRARFTGATSLQRGADSVLTLTVNAKSVCVVPSNLKFDKKPELTPAEAAEQAVVQGTPVSSSALVPGMPAFKPGVQLVFVNAPDVELADFLRAQRSNTVKDWQDFLVRYPSSTRLARAQNAMAALHQQAAEAAFGQYQKSSDARKQDTAMRRQQCTEAQAANRASAGYNPAIKLVDTIRRELDTLLQLDRARLQTFQKALQGHGSGYSQLAAARMHLEQLLEVRSDYAPLLNLRQEVAAEERKLEVTVANAESLTASARYDDAVRSLGPYNSFASAIPRVDAVVNAAYRYHLDSGQKLAAQQDWEQAVSTLRNAPAILPPRHQ